MTPVFLAALTFVSTLAGGLIGLKYKNRLHGFLGFTAGVLLGLVAFDLLPEIFELVNKNNLGSASAMVALVCGFLVFHIVEKSILIHHSHESEYETHKHPHVGIASAVALIGHSFLDGFGIGLGFQISDSVGLAVAFAVIAHDFSDGLNTVSLMIINRNSTKRAAMFLLADAIAPILGALATLVFEVSDQALVLYLGFFAGFLLYIGASEILPEAHSKRSSYKTIALTVLGAVLMFVVTRFA